MAGGHDAGDFLDGGTGNDVIAGDNAQITRLPANAPNPRMRVLQGQTIYGETVGVDDGEPLTTAVAQLDPTGAAQRSIRLLDHAVTTSNVHFGDDYIAGGAGDDMIFGQLGNDTIQGDGSIDIQVAATRDANVLLVGSNLVTVGTLRVLTSIERSDDGDDYIEGGGGDDLIFGGLGQDDIIGGSSTLFGLDAYSLRPDGRDLIFGGAGTDIARNDPGDGSHARDADVIAGDDAMSGAEALWTAAVKVYPDDGRTLDTRSDGLVVLTGYGQPLVLSDLEASQGGPIHVLGYEALKGEEFAAYDEYNPLARIMVDGVDFLLNFDHTEDDGNDRLFGGLGNDWIVGGTGHDHAYGGHGNDLINLDDNLSTAGGANNVADGPAFSYRDIAYGGAGRDVLIANTPEDRLIDWKGNFNTYVTPFNPQGSGVVSRTVQPALMEFLYELSKADGADPTRSADTGSSAHRNGEPDGELGLLLHGDDGYYNQTGATADLLPGAIPGGEREIIAAANFNSGSAEGFFPDSGVWNVSGGRLEVAPEVFGGDAVSVLEPLDLPVYFEVRATINAGKPTSGLKSNAFIVFDYQGENDFKYAGVNISNNKMEMGYRDASGWHELKQSNAQLRSDRDYQVLLSVNGLAVTLVVNGTTLFTHVFAGEIDDTGYASGLNDGQVGIGAQNSHARIDNFAVQVLPPELTLELPVGDFSTSDAVSLFSGDVSGQWVFGVALQGTPDVSSPAAIRTADLRIGSPYMLRIETDLVVAGIGGVVFDQYSPNDFKFAVVSAQTNQVLIGHHTARNGWVVDAMVNRSIGNVSHKLTVIVQGTTVSVLLDGQSVLGYSFNANSVDGAFGLLSRGGTSSFTTATISTNDPAFLTGGDNLLAETTARNDGVTPLTVSQVTELFQEALRRWDAANPAAAGRVNAADIRLQVVDLPGDALGRAYGDKWIQLDVTAAGHGWFLDATPGDDTEFQGSLQGLAADLNSRAWGQIDVLTVLMHELGHLYGYDDEPDSELLMGTVLPSGTRRFPAAEEPGRLDDLPWYQVLQNPAVSARVILSTTSLPTYFLSDHRGLGIPAEPSQRSWLKRQDVNPDALDAVIAAFAKNHDHTARAAEIDALLTREHEQEHDSDQQTDSDWLLDDGLLDDLLKF